MRSIPLTFSASAVERCRASADLSWATAADEETEPRQPQTSSRISERNARHVITLSSGLDLDNLRLQEFLLWGLRQRMAAYPVWVGGEDDGTCPF
jgi:hypothetical protein